MTIRNSNYSETPIPNFTIPFCLETTQHFFDLLASYALEKCCHPVVVGVGH